MSQIKVFDPVYIDYEERVSMTPEIDIEKMSPDEWRHLEGMYCLAGGSLGVVLAVYKYEHDDRVMVFVRDGDMSMGLYDAEHVDIQFDMEREF